MKVNFYELNKSFSSKSDIIFLKNNNFWFFLSSLKSRYFGGFLFDGLNAYRFLDEIDFQEKIKEISFLSPSEVILTFKNNEAYLKVNKEGIEIIFNNFYNIKLTFDIKKIFDNNPWQRDIQIEKINTNTFLVKEFSQEKMIKILVSADSPLKENKEWLKKDLDFDKKRNSPPYEWWTFNGLEGKIREIKIKILDLKDNEIFSILKRQNLLPSLDNFLLSRIEALILKNDYFYLPAGLSWFYENWYRDELLGLFLLKDLLEESFLKERKNFYLSNLKLVFDKNKNFPTLEVIDTYLFFLLNLEDYEILVNFKLLEKYLVLWKNNFIKDNKIFIPRFGTWMDTTKREKALEISSMYTKVLERFSKHSSFYAQEANHWKETVKKEIKESKGDVNVIFSFLFLEDILSKKEWEDVFDNLLKENYLKWGGISSISRNDPKFLDEDDGELVQAYHRGDSWYYLNNLLAFSLNKINSKKYKEIIYQILKASLEDLLLDGALGWSSEISSAKERRSEGSLVQLWSISSLLFLSRALQNIDIVLESLSNTHHIISVES